MVRFEALIGDLEGLLSDACLLIAVTSSLAGVRLEGVAKVYALKVARKLLFDGVLRLPEAGDSKSKSPSTRPSF